MNLELTDLIALLEEEIAVGERLLLNLATQREALVAWNMQKLLSEMDAREASIRALNELETRRLNLLQTQETGNCPFTLGQLIGRCRESSPARHRLESVRTKARAIFSRLQKDDRDLNGLMKTLQTHLHEALKPLACPAVPLYDESGAALRQRPSTAIMHSKA
jgi:hypothetical protein